MENIAIIVAMAAFCLLLVNGHYINSVMLFAGMLGLYVLGGMPQVKAFLMSEPFENAASYTFTTVPLYLLMAQFIMKSGMIKNLYAIVFKIAGGRKGVLGVLSIFLGGMLGAISGSAVATAAAMGQICVPELRKRGYPGALAGCIAAASGQLSAVIPPSLLLIIYGVITEISIGKLFMASLIPGIITMGVFSVLSVIMMRTEKLTSEDLNYEVVTDIEHIPAHDLAISGIVGVAIIASIFGGIYTGKFTPTEAGAVGAFIAFLICVIMGRLSIDFMKNAIFDTIKVTGMMMIIIISCLVFAKFMTLSMVPRKLIELLAPLIAKPVLLLEIVLVFYYILFMFMDGTAGILMTVPILLPVLLQAHVDPIWFGCFLALLCSLGGMTPPVGMTVYAVGGICGVRIEKIFKISLIWALVASVVVGGLMIAFPQIALWLPSRMQ